MAVLHLIAIEKYKILKYNICYIMVKEIIKENKEDKDINNLSYCDFLKAIESQEKWRQKQIDILYRSGRPIFGKYVNGILVKELIYNLK